MQHDELLDHIFSGDDISWQSIIFDAVRSEQMDPWDIDIDRIAQRFVELLATFQEKNLRIPGKVILASAMLLRFKSHRFVDVDIHLLDQILSSGQEQEWDSDDPVSYDDTEYEHTDPSIPTLTPRTPQPRKRKVSVYDLVKALEKALEVKNRRKVLKQTPLPATVAPGQVFDLSVVMHSVFSKVLTRHTESQRSGPVTFSQLLQDDSREEKVFTFIPLLHLSTMRKLDLHQEEHFGDVHIELLSTEPLDKESISNS